MKLRNTLTTAGRKIHQDKIDISQLKLSHIKTHYDQPQMDWKNMLMIVPIPNRKYKSIVLDKSRGFYALKQSPDQLIDYFKKEHPLACPRTLRELANFVGIKNYVPFVTGDVKFSPLKTNKECNNRSWISVSLIDSCFPELRNHCSINFDGVDELILVDHTQRFVEQRIQDTIKLSGAQESYFYQAAQILTNYEQVTIKFPKNHTIGDLDISGFFRFYATHSIEIICDYLDYELTEEDLKVMINKLMS